MAWPGGLPGVPACLPACTTVEKGSGNNTYNSKKGNFVNKILKRNCKKKKMVSFRLDDMIRFLKYFDFYRFFSFCFSSLFYIVMELSKLCNLFLPSFFSYSPPIVYVYKSNDYL